MRVAIIGLGAVGMSVYQDLVGKTSHLVGVDIDPSRVEFLRTQGVQAATRIDRPNAIDLWIVCCSTDSQMEGVMGAVRSISPRPRALISVESTLQVGTMHRMADYFTSEGFTVGDDLFLVHTPHRIMFGQDHSPTQMVRVMGGVTPACLKEGLQRLRLFIPHLHPVHDVRIAELSKIAENAIRYIDVAFAEALAHYCTRAGMSFPQLHRAVNTKSNVRLPGVDYGIGGACLPLAVELLARLTDAPITHGAIETDRSYRESIAEHLCQTGGPVLLRGAGYKPGADDLRASPAVELARALICQGIEVHVDDPHASEEALVAAGLTPRSVREQPQSEYAAVVTRNPFDIQDRANERP